MTNGQAYADRRVSTRGRAANGKNDGRIVVLALIAHESDEAETDKLRSHLRGLFASDDGGKITEPLEGCEGGKAVALGDGLRPSRSGRLAICNVHELDAPGALVISGCGIGVLACRLLGVVCLAADEATKKGGDDGLGDDDLVID